MADTVEIRTSLATAHVGHSYYAAAEEWMAPFWSDTSIFLKMFESLDLANIVELACGYGRHTTRYCDRAGHITLVDINQDSIDRCKSRFSNHDNFSYIINSGADLVGLTDETYTSVMSYDAMVHFEASDVISYISEVGRILRPGGRALLHYSNNQKFPEGTYADDPHWRSFFSEKMFRHFASRNSLKVIESEIISWPPNDGTPELDAVTLVEKIS